MKGKTNVFVLLSIFMVLVFNYVLTRNPVTSFIDEKDLYLGIALATGAVAFGILTKAIVKFALKSSISYKPKTLWVISISFFTAGLFIAFNFFIDRYLPIYYIDSFYMDLVFQVIISFIMAALIYELFNYVSEYSVRRVLKVTIKGSELIDKGYADEALKLYEKILGKISKSEKPLLYALIRQNRAKSYYALSKRQDRKLYLEKAMNELEDILDIKELGEHLASIKASLADLYYDYYMEDDSIAYLNKALELYEWSMKCFSRDQNIEDYMDVLNKVNKAKEKLMLATIS